MTTFVNSSEAARLLGVSKPTLYAYVSRGLVARRTAIDGRSSLYDREQLERLIARSRRRSTPERPSIDVRVASSVTLLDDRALTFRGHDAVELAERADFERVAELLWTGVLPDRPAHWPVDRDALSICRATVDAVAPDDPIVALTLCAAALADRSTAETAVDDARRLLAVVPSVLGGPQRGSVAERLTRAWVRQPSAELIDAISRALVLLAHALDMQVVAERVSGGEQLRRLQAAGCDFVQGNLLASPAGIDTVTPAPAWPL